MASVYFHHKKSTGDIFYVGISSVDFCGEKHRAFNFTNRSELWKNIASKHGVNVEIVHNNIDLDEAFRLEKYYISKFGRLDLKTGLLCNFTDGGEGRTNSNCRGLVFCYNNEGVLTNTFQNYNEVAKFFNVSSSLIHKACTTIQFRVKGFSLLFEDSLWTIEDKLLAINQVKLEFKAMRKTAARKCGELTYNVTVLKDNNVLVSSKNIHELIDILGFDCPKKVNSFTVALKAKCKNSNGYQLIYS